LQVRPTSQFVTAALAADSPRPLFGRALSFYRTAGAARYVRTCESLLAASA